MIRLEVKHDLQHRKWHRLSVGFHHGINKPSTIHLLESMGWNYVLAYAIDNQMDPNLIAFRAIDDTTDKVVMSMHSHATQNRPAI